jgi:hypothetical protein
MWLGGFSVCSCRGFVVFDQTAGPMWQPELGYAQSTRDMEVFYMCIATYVE